MANKVPTKPIGVTDLSQFCRSTFTLTFAVEILGQDVWTDCNEGLLEQGTYEQGMKIQYQLYPGQGFDLDILIWPHTAKIWCGAQYGWVRTWHFLERRWLTFSISHAFPVRVTDFQFHVATVTPTVGVAALSANAKNDKNFDVSLPPLGFGVRRYFAPVLEAKGMQESLSLFLSNLIWKLIEDYIPVTSFDTLFDAPHPVTDVRHQHTCIDTVRETILNRNKPVPIEEPVPVPEAKPSRRDSKMPKEKEVKKKAVDIPKVKFEIRLSGERIMAGTGRVTPFEKVGDPIPDTPEIIVLISSNNLPAQDDLPIVFVNVENLCEIPLNELRALRVSHLYVKWRIDEEEHRSEPQPLKNESTINFNHHKPLPVPYELLSKIASDFLDAYIIELRAIRLPPPPPESKLFGYEKRDRDFSTMIPKPANDDLDFVIAVTKIDTKSLTKGLNSFLRGEYPLYPPTVGVKLLEREGYCTNDINCIRVPLAYDLIVKPDIILQAQMSLEVSIGIVGCKTHKLSVCFSRMFCAVKNSEAVMTLLRHITDINEDILIPGKRDDLMSGFAIDTGNLVVLYVEGPKDGNILRVWDMTEDFYPELKPMFSCSARYSSRIYPELLAAAVPFVILKMFVPLGILLACPPIYARPALPLPTRSAVLKLGRLVASELRSFPPRRCMPTATELKSFRLELCVAPRPTPIVITENALGKAATQEQPRTSIPSVSRINWDKQQS